MNRPLRVLYLSSLPARNTTSGSVVLHRHFRALGDGFELHQACDAPRLDDDRNYHELPRRRWFARLCNTRFFPFFHDLHQAANIGVSAAAIDAVVAQVRPDVIVTVAEGGVAAAADRAAQRAGVPLVTFLHDWAPGWLRASRAIVRLAERNFRRLYAASTAVLAVCPELNERLGPHRDAQVLPPIPDSAVPESRDTPAGPLVYAGVYRHVYGREIRALAETFLAATASSDLRLCGPGPDWTATPLGASGMQLGLVSRERLAAELAGAGALLVASPFDPAWEFIARYSFPSKIPEYCRFGKPLLLWGPENSAAARWARETGAALVIADEDPRAVVRAFHSLRQSPARAAELASRARQQADVAFAPARLQQIFEHTLLRVTSRQPAASAVSIAP